MKFSSCIRVIILGCGLLTLSACSMMAALSGDNSKNSTQMITNTYPTPTNGNDLIGKNIAYKIQPDNTLDQLATRFDVGVPELRAANPKVVPRHLVIGKTLTIPTEYILPPLKYRKGIVINVAEMRLFYFSPDGYVMTFPVALGRAKWRTPITSTYVYRKEEQPTWWVPKSIRDAKFEKTGQEYPRKIGPGPDNPLGNYAIYLHLNGYLIHGTNNEESIGRMVSSGCIRMYNKDVEQLYSYMKRGIPVHIVYYPNKVGWEGNKLYLEAHKPIYSEQNVYKEHEIPVQELIMQAIENRPANIDWKRVDQVLKQQRGVATVIGVAKEVG